MRVARLHGGEAGKHGVEIDLISGRRVPPKEEVVCLLHKRTALFLPVLQEARLGREGAYWRAMEVIREVAETYVDLTPLQVIDRLLLGQITHPHRQYPTFERWLETHYLAASRDHGESFFFWLPGRGILSSDPSLPGLLKKLGTMDLSDQTNLKRAILCHSSRYGF